MKRGLLVAALVLLPFAVLVALGFYFSAENDESPPEMAQRIAVVPNPIAVQPTIADAGIAAPVVNTPPTLLAPLEPQVRRCFAENHLTGRIRVRFTPQRDGGFSGITVDQNSTQNPYLAACVEDLLQTATFRPSPGPEYAPVDFTFSF
jgi:hypothetical protein